ncbi:MAG: Rieske 2Fe-2S domain-containing protein [Sediminibacterium sp.]|nr:Rieske 2Fe-2S domain-containing protein [Sediminibacterium sp.]TXT31324.1 MAG: Rieske (2Fe-2S) domain-containing protein [Chitinophagaceae bacterium]
MERRDFLGTLSAPVLVACAACMGACSKGSSSPSSSNAVTVTPPTNVNFSVDLGANLLTVGSAIAQSGVIIARLATGNSPASFTAVQQACTHEGTAINFSATSSQFICPNHGSVFNTNGNVLVGPATRSLRVYTLAVSGSTLTVTG